MSQAGPHLAWKAGEAWLVDDQCSSKSNASQNELMVARGNDEWKR